jgi:hypothetical protein
MKIKGTPTLRSLGVSEALEASGLTEDSSADMPRKGGSTGKNSTPRPQCSAYTTFKDLVLLCSDDVQIRVSCTEDDTRFYFVRRGHRELQIRPQGTSFPK